MSEYVDGHWKIDAPGQYVGMTDEDYHADPVQAGSLSHSDLKLLMDCPARLAYRRSPGYVKVHKGRHFDEGHVAHSLVLGTGSPVRVIEADDWRTKAARQALDAARAAGEIPVKAEFWARAQGMAAALREHPTAGKLFVPGSGTAELVVVWFDDEFGIWRRAKIDWMTRLRDGRLAIVDYKTTKSARPSSVARSVWDYGYDTQNVYYTDGVEAVGLGENVAFLNVFQETTPPYIATVSETDPETRAWARVRIRKGLATYAQCLADDRWPGYADDQIIPVGLPRWADRQLSDAWDAGEFRVEET